MKTISVKKTIIFHLMTSGAKTTDLRSNVIEKRYRGIRELSNTFFESSPMFFSNPY